MDLVAEVGPDLIRSPSWRVDLPIATPCVRWSLVINHGAEREDRALHHSATKTAFNLAINGLGRCDSSSCNRWDSIVFWLTAWSCWDWSRALLEAANCCSRQLMCLLWASNVCCADSGGRSELLVGLLWWFPVTLAVPSSASLRRTNCLTRAATDVSCFFCNALYFLVIFNW